jgi:hypothetical protein
MLSQTLQKAHYDLIYKNVVRRSENTQMDLNCFFEALEDIAQRLYSKKGGNNVYDSLVDTIQNIIVQI